MATDETRQFLERMRQMELRQVAGAIKANSQANLLRRHTYDPGAYVRNDAWSGSTPLYSTLHHPVKPFEAMSGSGNPGSLWNVEGRKYAEQLMKQRAAELEGIRNPDLSPSSVAEAATPLPLPSDLPPAIQKRKEELITAWQSISDDLERTELLPTFGINLRGADLDIIERNLPYVLLYSTQKDIMEMINFNDDLVENIEGYVNEAETRLNVRGDFDVSDKLISKQYAERLRRIQKAMSLYVADADEEDRVKKLRLKTALKESGLNVPGLKALKEDTARARAAKAAAPEEADGDVPIPAMTDADIEAFQEEQEQPRPRAAPARRGRPAARLPAGQRSIAEMMGPTQ